jgi:hypothetical protein
MAAGMARYTELVYMREINYLNTQLSTCTRFGDPFFRTVLFLGYAPRSKLVAGWRSRSAVLVQVVAIWLG